MFLKKEIWVSFWLERFPVRTSAPEMQIILIREKKFLLWKKKKRQKEAGRGACECLISLIHTLNHINIFGDTVTDHHLQGNEEENPNGVCPSPL